VTAGEGFLSREALPNAVQARLAAPFGSVQVTVDDEARLLAVDLSPEARSRRVPDGFPAAVHEAFEAYLDGETQRPQVPVGSVDVTAFQRSVLEALVDVEPGQPVTYGDLAERIGKPNAARAVGQALRANPVPLVWPCHRVVARDGLGGFGGASEAAEGAKLSIKRWLLDHESHATSPCLMGKA
jgi:methylated-DNA-[protein]-cysteine S-methyltransferase